MERVIEPTPNRLPVIQLVDSPCLSGLVINRQLHAGRRAKKERLAATIDGHLLVVLNTLNAGEIPLSSCPAVHARYQINRRRPALNIQGQMHGALIGLALGQQLARQIIKQGLQLFRAAIVDQMRRHLELEVSPHRLGFDIVILDQGNQTEVGILQLELITRIPAHAPGMPLDTSKLDQAGRLEQIQDLGPRTPPVQLADGIHSTAQQTHAGQIGLRHGLRVDENPLMGLILGELRKAGLIGGSAHPANSFYVTIWCNQFLKSYLYDVLQGRQGRTAAAGNASATPARRPMSPAAPMPSGATLRCGSINRAGSRNASGTPIASPWR
ncbi:hypothetical protein D3C78_356650 [compost metagenome]